MTAAVLVFACCLAAGPPDFPPVAATGTVLDAAGAPVAGAAVGAVAADGATFTARTAADGTFSLPVERTAGVPDWPFLIARGPGGELAAGPERPGAGDFPATLTLAPPRELAVAVRAPGGAPAPGVPVYALAANRPVAVAAGGPDGVARLAVPAGLDLDAVVASRPGVGFGYAPPGGGSADQPDRLTVRLGEPFAHRVRIVAADPETGEPEPLPGATARLFYARQPGRDGVVNLSGCGFATATAGDDGVAAFDWLPADAEGALFLLIDAEGHSRERCHVDPAHPAAEQTVELKPAAALFGRVTHPDGSPAAGVTVRAAGTYIDAEAERTRDDDRTALTDAAGRYETVARGDTSYLILALPDGETAAAEAAGRDGTLVPQPGGRVGVDFALAPGTPVAGRVTLGEGGDAEPLAGRRVGLVAYGEPPVALKPPTYPYGLRDPDLTRTALTDSGGRYAFRVGPGEYRAWAEGAARLEKFTVDAGGAPVVRDFAVPRPSELTVSGVVTDDVGLTLPGVTVTLTRWRPPLGRGGRQTVVTDADGAFSVARTFEGPPENWSLYLSVTEIDDLRGPLHGWIDLSAGVGEGLAGPTAGLTLAAHRQTALTGTAVDAAGAPLAGVELSARPSDVNSWRNDDDPLNPTCVTGPNGRFLFRGVFVNRPTTIRYSREEPNGAATHTVSRTVGEVVPTAGAVAEVAPQDGLRKTGVKRPPVDDRAEPAFAAPDGPAAAVKQTPADAALLGRRALVLVADPATDAGRALFSLLYDDREIGAAADAGYLTRCLAPDNAPFPAGTLTALGAAGEPLGTLAVDPTDRAAVLAFLAAHRPAASAAD